MTASPEQHALVSNPNATSAQLAELASSEPELWPAIAAHPNADPELLARLRDSGPSLSHAEPARPSVEDTGSIATPSGADLVASWVSSHWRVLISAAGAVAAAALALTLVVNLVIVPQQVEAAALAEAIAAFDKAARECDRANNRYETAIARAEDKASIDPAALADPTLVDDLRTAINTSSDLERCSAPPMAREIDAIVEQSELVGDNTGRVDAVVDELKAAVSAIDRSVAEKGRLEAEAAEAAAAEAEAAETAEAAARLWTMSDPQGFSFTASLTVDAPVTTFTLGEYNLGEGCGFDPSLDVAIPVTMKVTATTQGFDTPISALVFLNQRSAPSTPHEVVIEAYYSSGPTCKYPVSSSDTFLLNGVSWPDSFSPGQSATHRFMVIIRNWRTPATPDGDTAFLDTRQMYVTGGQGSDYTTDDGHKVTLSNRVI